MNQVNLAGGHTEKVLSPHEVGWIPIFLAQISSGRLADTPVRDEGGAYRPRFGERALDMPILGIGGPGYE